MFKVHISKMCIFNMQHEKKGETDFESLLKMCFVMM